MQSLAVVADEHRFHQDGVGHREFEQHDYASLDYSYPDHHQHMHNNFSYEFDTGSALDISAELDANGEPDCHHCCHCHGTKLNYLMSASALLPFASKQQNLGDFHQFALSALTLPLLRPPIA
ncbi:MAG: hypothetical protein COA42_21830 [Alteromonadaceae bacterium]|nr:MAG: hypothetical protein COA42_21830 [Alteromonadaceae bacterium]